MIAFLIGIVLGVLYFGGLYLSVERLNRVKHPSILMVLSFILRMGLLVVVFFYISKGGYKDILFALGGLILVRFIMIFRVKKEIPNPKKRGD